MASSIYQGQQFSGDHWWFTVEAARCVDEPEKDVMPSVEIHVVEHTNREDSVPHAEVTVRGRKNIEAVMKACQYALSAMGSKLGKEELVGNEVTALELLTARKKLRAAELAEALMCGYNDAFGLLTVLVGKGLAHMWRDGETFELIEKVS